MNEQLMTDAVANADLMLEQALHGFVGTDQPTVAAGIADQIERISVLRARLLGEHSEKPPKRTRTER